MLLLAPILGAGYPSSTPTAPTPPHETELLSGMTFPEDDWDDTWAYPLLDGPDLADTSDADINATMEVCCEVEDPVGPDCAEMSASCSAGLTQHRVRGWEDGGTVSFDGADLVYGYSQHDITRLVLCYQPCFASCLGGGGSQSKCAAQCDVYCGAEVLGPDFDNESEEFDLYASAIDSTVWKGAGPSATSTPNTSSAETSPSTTHDGSTLAFVRIVGTTNYHKDIYLSEPTGSPPVWDTPTAVSDVNTPCNEDNPHVVVDELGGNDGLRLYFDSDRDPEETSWTSTSDCVPGASHLWVARRDHTDTWGDPVLVDLPAADADETWANGFRRSPFVTAHDPAEQIGDPPANRGRYIFWSGREDDCAASSTKPALGCIYRAEQSGDDAIDDPWTNVTLIVRPTAYADATFGDVIYVDHPSITGDGQYFHFTYITPSEEGEGVEPPVDTSERLDDPDTGVEFVGENWEQAYALSHPANYAVNGDTSGWEDSSSVVSPDGRTIYFAYNEIVTGQGLWSSGGSCSTCGPAVPSYLLNSGVERNRTTFPKAKSLFDMYKATIDTSGQTPVWDDEYLEVNYENYCTPDAQCSGCDNPCLDRPDIDDTHCLNPLSADPLITAADPDCALPEDAGMNEAGLTASTSNTGTEALLFTRYGDLRDLEETLPDPLPASLFTFRIYETRKDCGTGSDEWCEPWLATFSLDDDSISEAQKNCVDNDPHLFGGASFALFDSNRMESGETKECEKFLADDFNVYLAYDMYNPPEGGWDLVSRVEGGPNQVYIDWDDDAQCDECCASCPSDCPLPCEPTENSGLVGKRIWKGHQPFANDLATFMYFLGDGPDCVPDGGSDSLSGFVGGCIYRSKWIQDGSNPTVDPAEFEDPVLIAKPQPNTLPCYEDAQSFQERIVGLGEPSLTKDGRFLYFLYMKKTSVGTPIPECDDPEYTGTPPDDPCRCEDDDIENQTEGCTPRPCQLATGDPPPGCVNGCTEPEIEDETECLPWATLMCESPDTATGVDGYEFGIAVARRPSWNVNLGVVRAN